MVTNMLDGAVGRLLRVALHFVIAKLLLVPLMAQIPGLSQFLSNPDLTSWAVGAVTAALNALLKKLRDSGTVPAWLPL